MKQQEWMNIMARAYELQEVLKKERQQVRQHDEEYKRLMDRIASSKVQRAGKYEVVDKEVQRQHFIISDKFRERWPQLFNQLATVKLKDAKQVLEDTDLEAVLELKTVTKPTIVVHDELQIGGKDIRR